MLALALVSVLLGLARPALAQEGLPTIVQDDAQLLHRSDADTRASLARLQAMGVTTVRATAGWSVLTREADSHVAPAGFDQTDPAAYEDARFRGLDRLVRLAPEYGLDVMLDIAFWAPHWATQDLPGPRARTYVDAAAYARFAAAIARRYAGAFVPVGAPAAASQARSGDDAYLDGLYGLPGPTDGRDDGDLVGGLLGSSAAPSGPLPRVKAFTLWNEPNHPAFLQPQWIGKGAARHPASADVYRAMVQAAYPAVKAIQPDATVLVGGTAAQSAGAKGVAPLAFLRRLACVDAALKPITDGPCGTFAPVPGDGWAHHPYSLRTLPNVHATDPDQVPIADLDRLTGLLGRLVAAGRLSPALADVWITEYGYETNPPDPSLPFSTGDQARFLTWAEYLAWRTPHVRSFAQFLLRDLPPTASVATASARRSQGQWQSGLAFADGTPKLASDTFTAGLFVRPTADPNRIVAWGRLRTLAVGELREAQLQVRAPGSLRFRSVASVPPGGGPAAVSFPTPSVVSREVSGPRAGRYRLRYRAADGSWRVTPSVGLTSGATG